VRSDLVDKVTSASEIDVHDIMVEHELDDMVEDYSSELVRQGFAQMPHAPGAEEMVPEELQLSGQQRVALTNYLLMAGTTLENVRDQWRERAMGAVKSRLVLEAIADAENIEVSQDEVEEELKKTAESMNHPYEEVKRVFEQRGTLGILKQRMTVDKTIDWLKDHAKITEEDAKASKQKAKKETKQETDDTEKEK
jgi:trigger factor